MKRGEPESLSRIRVLKFGGTCMHPERNRRLVIDRINDERAEGFLVVAVVSAMGRKGDPFSTDTLDALIPDGTPVGDRERDALLTCGEGIAASLLAAELNAAGVQALSLRGIQIGLITDGHHGAARVVAAAPEAVTRHLDGGSVVVAAGFQGVGTDGAVTTLGRGGSDTAAAALAAALDADRVVFYKDVAGLYSADPRIVPAASHLPRIPYDEAAHLAHAGARALHPECAGLAEEHGIPIEIKSIARRGSPTLITSLDEIERIAPRTSGLFAVTSKEGIVQVAVSPLAPAVWPEFPERLFNVLAEKSISLDMIGILHDQALFTVPAADLPAARDCAESLGCEVRIRPDCAKVSLLGGGIHGVPGIMARIVSALAREEIPIYQSTDTYTVISILVDRQHGPVAVRSIHTEFGLDAANSKQEGTDILRSK